MAKKENEKNISGLEQIFAKNGINIKTLSSVLQNNDNVIVEISLSVLIPNRYQPRSRFDEEKLNELAASIRKHGIITPIIVRFLSDDQYEIVAGERRVRASKLADKETIPAIIADFNDKEMMEIALIENIQREDLTSIEEARSYNEMKKIYGYTQEQIAKELGKSRSHVANLLRLLTLPELIQNHILDGKISTGHAKLLIGLDDALAIEITNKIIVNGYSVKETENILKKTIMNKIKIKKTIKYENEEQLAKQKLKHDRITISKTQIKIIFKNSDELNNYLKKL